MALEQDGGGQVKRSLYKELPAESRYRLRNVAVKIMELFEDPEYRRRFEEWQAARS